MAFCKFCGSEIPEGGVCSCPAAQAEAQGQNAAAQVNDFAQDNNVYGQGGANQNNNFNPNELVDKAKKNPAILIGAAAALLVLIILLVFICGNMGAKGAAKKYAKALSKKGKGKTYYSLTLPKDKIKDLKDDDKWDDMVDDYNDHMSDTLDDYKIKVKSVKKGKKLSKKALKGAEAVWESYGADDPTAKKGYEFKIKIQAKDKDDDDKETNTEKVCVVKFKGEGWKVIPMEAESLENKGDKDKKSSSSSYDFDDYDLDDYDLDDFDF
ncbi:MAG TPA: hypothetical protein P5191_10690 [Ruminococcus sp.]|nr:hypothetical protein [Ruminococcus sp.]